MAYNERVEQAAERFVEQCLWDHVDPQEAVRILRIAWRDVLDKEKRQADYGFEQAAKGRSS